MPYFKIKSYSKSLGKKTNLIQLEKNLIDQIWKTKPKKSTSKPFVLEKNFAGESTKSKINKIVELEDTPSIRGMIKKVNHLVQVIED